MSYLSSNLLDLHFYYQLKDRSTELRAFEKTGLALFEDFPSFMEDLFLLLYKKALRYETKEPYRVSYQMITQLMESPKVQQLRTRTQGEKTQTYIAMKVLLDELFERLRGSQKIKDLEKTLSALENLEKIFYENLLEKVSLEDFLSEEEMANLEKVASHLLEEGSLKDMLKDIYVELSGGNPSTDISSPSAKAINTSEENSFTEYMSQLNQQIEAKESQEEAESDDEITMTKSSEDLIKEGEIRKDFENRLENTVLYHKRMTTGTQQQGEGQFIQETKDDPDISMIQQGSPSTDEAAFQKEYSISRETENQLRSIYKNWASPDTMPHPPKDLEEFPAEIQRLRQSLKGQLESLGMEPVYDSLREEIDDFVERTQTLGIQKQSMDSLEFDEVISIYKRFRRPEIAKFIQKIGRNKQDARKAAMKKKRKKVAPRDKAVLGSDLDNLIDDEYIHLSLDIESFETDFYERYLRDSLLTIEMVATEDESKGPFILCYDGSGSMDGAKIRETQGQILTILEIARLQKRKMVLIQFASAAEPLFIKELNPASVSATDVLEILNTYLCGGTDFQKPLEKAMEYIRKDVQGKSDILFITDGEHELSESFQKKFLDFKKQRKFKLYTIIIHPYTYGDYGSIGKISDEVLAIQERDLSDWNKKVNERLFKLF